MHHMTWLQEALLYDSKFRWTDNDSKHRWKGNGSNCRFERYWQQVQVETSATSWKPQVRRNVLLCSLEMVPTVVFVHITDVTRAV
jgi:hypothetical protein